MELLLNLLWLLLVVPALWVWRRHDRSLGPSCSLMVLACGLVLIFPAVSASDDLQLMRPEIVESGPLKQRTIEKASAQNQFPSPHAILTSFFVVAPCLQVWGQPQVQPFFPHIPVHTRVLPTRAPPVSALV